MPLTLPPNVKGWTPLGFGEGVGLHYARATQTGFPPGAWLSYLDTFFGHQVTLPILANQVTMTAAKPTLATSTQYHVILTALPGGVGTGFVDWRTRNGAYAAGAPSVRGSDYIWAADGTTDSEFTVKDPSGTTLATHVTGTVSDRSFLNAAGRTALGQGFQVTAGGDVGSVVLPLKGNVQAPLRELYVEIRANSTGMPGNFDAMWRSRSVLSGSLTTSYADITFNFAPYADLEAGALAEFFAWDGTWRTVLGRRGSIFYTTGAAWTQALAVAGLQVRQFFVGTTWAPVEELQLPVILAAAGPAGALRYSRDGITWSLYHDVATQEEESRAWAVWIGRFGTTDSRVFVLSSSDGQVYNSPFQDSEAAWAATGAYIRRLGSIEPFLLGTLDGDSFFLANGPYIYAFDDSGGSVGVPSATLKRYSTSLSSITAGSSYRDAFVISEGDRVKIWHPSRPEIDISPWKEMGCPSDFAGRFRSFQPFGDYILALWELDAGGTYIMWMRPDERGQVSWHVRSTSLTGVPPLSSNAAALVTENTLSGRRRLWTIAGDQATYYQDHPFPGLDPTTDSGITYADGFLYLYTAWYELATAGELVAIVREIQVNASVSAAEQISVDYRIDYASTAEVGASWTAVRTLKTNVPSQVDLEGTGGRKVLAVQFRIGLDRGGGNTLTPILREFFMMAEGREARPR